MDIFLYAYDVMLCLTWPDQDFIEFQIVEPGPLQEKQAQKFSSAGPV